MSVYTTLDHDTLVDYLAPFAVGELVDFRGIEAGVENTNYFITTAPSRSGYDANDTNEYVLTLFEYLNVDELSFFVRLQSLLAQHHLPVANPVVDCDGVALKILAEKPALLFPRLPGGHPDVITPAHCSAMGEMMAKFHRINSGDLFRKGHRGLEWLQHENVRLKPFMNTTDYQLMCDELAHFEKFMAASSNLPQGIIHADLFRDNALFVGDELTGVIDFYNACNGYFIYDLAIMVNDWCVTEDGTLDMPRYLAMMRAYQLVRPLNKEECEAWQTVLRGGALRFWTSRLVSMHLPEDLHKKGTLTQFKNPEHFKRILQDRIKTPYPLA